MGLIWQQGWVPDPPPLTCAWEPGLSGLVTSLQMQAAEHGALIIPARANTRKA